MRTVFFDIPRPISPEQLSQSLAEAVKERNADLFLLPHTPANGRAAARAAAELGERFFPRVTSVKRERGFLLLRRPAYSGYLEAQGFPGRKTIATAEAGGKTADPAFWSAYGTVERAELEMPEGIVPALVPVKTEPKALSPIRTAKTVFLGGRGLQSRANYERLKRVAERFGAACGCTRPVALNGWESFDNFVGISGAQLDCDLCVAFGVSGAGPLVSGLGRAGTLIAVNTDPDALIFERADLAVVADCMDIIRELEEM